MPAWSYSAIKTFNQCPKKYYHINFKKDVKFDETDQIRFGNKVHKVAEENTKYKKPIPKEFDFLVPVLNGLDSIGGTSLCELKLAVKWVADKLVACDYFDKNTWWRGAADRVIFKDSLAYSVDYKTGNAKYADTKQLDLIAGALFIKYPEVKKIKSALIFVQNGEMVKETHEATHAEDYLLSFKDDVDRLEHTIQTGEWIAKPSRLCNWCNVTHCQFRES